MNKKAAFMTIIVAGIIGAILLIQSDLSLNNATAEVALIETKELSAPVQKVTLKAKVDHSDLADAPLDTDYVIGSSDAPVTMIEYASLSCPHCAHSHTKVLPKIKKHYIDSGKVRYMLRQFPLNEPAMKGAQLVHCAGKKGGSNLYYTFNGVLFDAQSKWAFDANFEKSLQTFAEVGGISAGEFAKCMDNLEIEKHVLTTRKNAGEELGIDGTPYIFLNGHPHAGNKSFEAIRAEIDTLLATE